MEDIKLHSRYKDVKTIFRPINEFSGVLLSNGNYTRCIFKEDSETIEGIDFEGGPMLYIGEELEGTNKKIKNVKRCYYVELE